MRRHHRLLVAAGLLAPSCAPAHTAHRARSSAPPPTAGPHPAEPGADEAEPGTGETPTSPAGPASTPVLVVSGLPAATDGTTTTRVRPRPTTTLPENVGADASDAEWWASQPGYQSATREALLACIRRYESGGDYEAISTTGQYRGAYQFDRGTWSSVGGSGDPATAPAAEQDARAWALYLSRGLAPWPTPKRMCG